MNVFSSETFMVLTHIASPNAFGNCAHMVINSLSAKSVLAGEKLVAMYSIST
jgi:hypothetical protein